MQIQPFTTPITLPSTIFKRIVEPWLLRRSERAPATSSWAQKSSSNPLFLCDAGALVDSGVIFFLLFSAQKSDVKPPNHLNHSKQRKSSWHVSSAPTAIMNI